MGNQDIGHYAVVCKNTDLFVRLEEKYTKNDIIEIIKRYRKREAIEDFDILDTTTIFREILEGNIE